MRLSARAVAGIGAVGLALANVGRIPSAAVGGRSSPFVAGDLALLLMWGFLGLALSSVAIRPVVDRVFMASIILVQRESQGRCPLNIMESPRRCQWRRLGYRKKGGNRGREEKERKETRNAARDPERRAGVQGDGPPSLRLWPKISAKPVA